MWFFLRALGGSLGKTILGTVPCTSLMLLVINVTHCLFFCSHSFHFHLFHLFVLQLSGREIESQSQKHHRCYTFDELCLFLSVPPRYCTWYETLVWYMYDVSKTERHKKNSSQRPSCLEPKSRCELLRYIVLQGPLWKVTSAALTWFRSPNVMMSQRSIWPTENLICWDNTTAGGGPCAGSVENNRCKRCILQATKNWI